MHKGASVCCKPVQHSSSTVAPWSQDACSANVGEPFVDLSLLSLSRTMVKQCWLECCTGLQHPDVVTAAATGAATRAATGAATGTVTGDATGAATGAATDATDAVNCCSCCSCCSSFCCSSCCCYCGHLRPKSNAAHHLRPRCCHQVLIVAVVGGSGDDDDE